jgi:FlaA1/EpsC-like NDP-sugar epimerase
MITTRNEPSFFLIIGDFVAFLIVTIIGFFNHNSQLDLLRILANWIPLCLAWSMAAPLLGLWKPAQHSLLTNWWKIIWAVVLSVPLAVVIRGFILNTPTIGIFVLVMIATSVAGLFVWRLLWFFLQKKLMDQKNQ